MRYKTFDEIKKLTDVQKDMYALEMFKHFREIGFPHFKFSDGYKYNVFNKLKKLDLSKEWEIEDGKIHTSMYVLGYDVASSFMPHMQETRTHTNEKLTTVNSSPMDIFNDDRRFLIQIRKLMNFSQCDPNTLRNFLKYGFNAKRVSNFRPVAAMAIWNKYMVPGTDIVYDPSMGYGGRLVGALAFNKVKKYIGTDPAEVTYKSLVEISEFFEGKNGSFVKTDPKVFVNRKTRLINAGSENVLDHMDNADIGKVGCVFTSPPYFAQEVYSHEATQSWKKFPTPQQWMRGFLRTTLLNAKRMIAKNAYIIINIDKVETYPTLVEDMLEMIAQDEKDNGCGLALRETLYLKLGTIAHLNMSKIKKRLAEEGVDVENFDMKPAGFHKLERIFVFQRKEDKHWSSWSNQKTLF